MNKIRIFPRVQAAGTEPDLSFLFIHLLDAAYHPFAFSYLVFHLPGLAINQIQMMPAVPFGQPDNFATVVDFVTKMTPAIERFRFFGD